MSNIGLIGIKLGMSREFFSMGLSVPVTVIKIEKGRVIDLITKDQRGYDAIKVGFAKIKPSQLTKSMKGFYSKKKEEPKKEEAKTPLAIFDDPTKSSKKKVALEPEKSDAPAIFEDPTKTKKKKVTKKKKQAKSIF